MNTVLLEKCDGYAVVTLNRPDARNALSPELSRGLRESIAWAEADDEIGALVITGAGKAFCAGAELGLEGQDKPTCSVGLSSRWSFVSCHTGGLTFPYSFLPQPRWGFCLLFKLQFLVLSKLVLSRGMS